ncbi:MAG: rhodanese-like domain-containing protein [Candidatus Promineifilaceae bacterium]
MKSRIPYLMLALLLAALALAGCGGAAAPAPAADQAALEDLPQTVDVDTVYELRNNPDVYLLDVREQDEYDESHIPNITLLPMSTIQNRVDEIPTDKTVIVTCRTGNRSSQVAEFLRANGFENVHNMDGGIVAWENAGYPVER